MLLCVFPVEPPAPPWDPPMFPPPSPDTEEDRIVPACSIFGKQQTFMARWVFFLGTTNEKTAAGLPLISSQRTHFTTPPSMASAQTCARFGSLCMSEIMPFPPHRVLSSGSFSSPCSMAIVVSVALM